MSTVTRRRLVNQGLVGAPLPGPAEVVGWMGCVQAQDYPAARWGVAQRTAAASEGDLDRLLDQGAILRTHVLRPTWHLVLPRDVRWLLALTGPRVHRAAAGAYRNLALDGALFTRSERLLARALRGGGALTRTQLAAVLRGGGIACDGIRLAHILMHAELEAVIVSGGRRGKQMTYALLDERAPAAPSLDRTAALAELARRYFASHGPATAADAAWWSGLTVADVEAGIAAAGLSSVEVGGRVYWGPARDRGRAAVATDAVHLLPSYDEYLVAYRDRAAAIHSSARLSGMESLAPTVAVGGQVVGSWRRTIGRDEIVIEIQPFAGLAPPPAARLNAVAQRYARFAGMAVRVQTGGDSRRRSPGPRRR